MKDFIQIETITQEEFDALRKFYKDDYVSDDCDHWFGLKGTTPIKCVVCNEEEWSLIHYQICVQDLRRTTKFLAACLTDGDVNHSLAGLEDNELSKDDMQCLYDWYIGKTDMIPVTACGLVNYVDSYIDSPLRILIANEK